MMQRTNLNRLLVAIAALSLIASAWAQPAELPAEPYVWRNVVIGGGGFVTGIIFHPHQKDLMYGRTDVGGAYRWDATAQRWISLTDWIGIEDVNLAGIESLALDPSDPNCLYLAAGTYSRGRAAILRSDDQGRTFKRTNVPFGMGGNEAGRFNGERLAVDPNQGEILFFGSRHDGLWKSLDRAATWQRVESFPKTESDQSPAPATRPRGGFGQQPAGIVCVLFDPASGNPGGPTSTLYAAVSTTGTNLFRSTDSGATWQAVTNQPVGLRPNHLVRSPDGMLYLSYGKEPGPNTMTDGAIWKFNPAAIAWTDITPLKSPDGLQPFGYGAVAVDAQHPSTLVAATFAHWKPHDEVFRSTNSGATWTPLLQTAKWDFSNAPYTETLTPHWIGDIEINPFNADQVLFTTGYGIWNCLNATDAASGRPTRWVFLNKGLEETVPLALISPPKGALLLSGLGDIDGFRHEDLNVSPKGTFAGPRFSNTEDLALAGQNPSVIVRSGTGGDGAVRAAISEDGGLTWSALGSEPPGGGEAGSIAICARGRTIVWTPRRSTPYYSVDRGTNWTACEKLGAGARVVADTINPLQFYAFDPRGRFTVSTNAAVSFTATEPVFPITENNNPTVWATPGIEGDVWLSVNNSLYHSTNAGASFTRLEHVNQARALGFGKAAPGKNSPALYLAGKVDQLQALFRSDDTGQTWTRINDDQHQFGWIGRVTGDPRIYGRVYFGTGGRGIFYGDPVPGARASN
jgi:hypothetical protein